MADTQQIAAGATDLSKPPRNSKSPAVWVQEHLFNNVMNSIITVVLGAVIVFLAFKGAVWIIDEQWDIFRVNLRNFMIGQFPPDELWRPWVSGFLLLGSVSLAASAMARTNHDVAVDQGLPAERSSWLDLLRRTWPVLAFVALMLSFAETWLPRLGILAAIGLVVGGRILGWALPYAVRSRAVLIGAVGVLASLAVLAGTGGLVAVVAGLIAVAGVGPEVARRLEGGDVTSRIVRTVAPLAAGVIVWFAVKSIGFDGFGWEEWGGMHLTLFVTVVGIATGMPLGILLAIGRRSELPVIKAFCVIFIEFVRGVPLISLLFFANLMLPLLFPVGASIPGGLSRAMIVITLFSAAYIAEIVRGGLQAVPKGQTEAAQASGMSAGKIQRLIVMPQALRAVIPSMVGQFISLFKDTSLLGIVAFAEWFQYSKIVNNQPDFLGKGLQLVTITIVAFGYWAFAYTMSKESRRLEEKLGVGVR
jgi:general L-amino acid transport system permease protein